MSSSAGPVKRVFHHAQLLCLFCLLLAVPHQTKYCYHALLGGMGVDGFQNPIVPLPLHPWLLAGTQNHVAFNPSRVGARSRVQRSVYVSVFAQLLRALCINILLAAFFIVGSTRHVFPPLLQIVVVCCLACWSCVACGIFFIGSANMRMVLTSPNESHCVFAWFLYAFGSAPCAPLMPPRTTFVFFARIGETHTHTHEQLVF